MHSLKFLEKGVMYYAGNKDYSLGLIASYFSILKLISSRTPSVLRARKSSAQQKIRKGAPVGAKLTFRKTQLDSFYCLILHQILPQLSSFKPLTNIAKNNEMVVSIAVTDIFLFGVTAVLFLF